MALHKKCAVITGYDIDPEAIAMAEEKKIVDLGTTNLRKAVQDADLIILATPVNEILAILSKLSDLQAGETIIMDLGSTKVKIMEAMDCLPGHFDPIGGHPMCGKETSGLLYAEEHLFQDKIFALTPLERTSTKARTIAESLVKTIGAIPIYLDPAVHDLWTASTSHLPYLISVALTLATPIDAAPMIGPGFRSSTRIAASSPDMMMDILFTNKNNIISSLRLFRQQINAIEEHLENEDLIAVRGLLETSVSKLNQLVEHGRGEKL